MMAEREQSYTSHRRWLPVWHFFVAPVLTINVLVATWRVFQYPVLGSAWHLVVAMALLVGILWSRQMPVTTQDRVIRLEERTRMARVLPAEMRGNEEGLTRGQYVALRFAPDDELPELVRRVHSGELKSSDDIKR
ncbi:MAG: DUF6526 family protein, partial [Gemmatimonadota bacterium]|nr:DUF6526 family protein [Gemmatimonadota bacterium]